MKIKNGYILREVAGNNIVVPVGKLDFDGVISLNETGVVIWKKLQDGCETEDLVAAFISEYDVSEDLARNDIDLFLAKLREADLLDE